jgi:twinkle protein
MKVEEYLTKKGFRFKRRGENLIMNCPFCGETEQKFAVNSITGAFNCLHLNTCGVKGSFYDFQKKLGDEPERPARQKFYNQPKPTYKKPAPIIENIDQESIQFLHEREISDKTIKDFELFSSKGSIAFPYYKNGKLVNVKYRSLKEKKFWGEKDSETVLFNRDNIEKNSLVIVEGEMDCLALYEYGIESVSIPGGANNMQWVDNEWDYLETFEEIYLCYDSDPAGQQGMRDVAIKLGEWRCKLVSLPFKDANECLINKVPAEAIISCIANAKDMTPETLVTPMYFLEDVQKLFSQGKEIMGIKTPWEKLDHLLKGWRDGEITVWSGKNGAGKSTILNQVFLDSAEKGIKSCIFSGEMSPARYLRWAVIQYQENDAPHPDRIETTLSWLSSRVYILNLSAGIKPEKLLGDFEYAARRYNVKHFIIDSLMKVSLPGSDEYKEQQGFMNQLSAFAQKHKAHIHLVAHPRKTESDDDTPGKVDVKGSSHITDMADNVIVMHRQSQEQQERVKKQNKMPADAKLFIKKNREFGIEGVVNLLFNTETKKFND